MPITGSDPALMYAQSAVIRSGASRSNYHSAFVYISINGTQRRDKVMFGSLTITDLLDEQPNTCRFTVSGITPSKGQEVIIGLGSTHQRDRLFAGHIIRVRQTQKTAAAPVFYQVECIDYTWLLNKLKVSRQYTNESATTIVRDLIATYATGFTTGAVQTGLATVDEVTFTEKDLPSALTHLAKRIGGYWYADYLKNIHFWTDVETGVTNPTNLTTAHTSMSDLSYDDDVSQIVTRVRFEGGGVNALAAVAVGAASLPVQSVAWYDFAGGVVKCGPQLITYTATVTGGDGSLVGPGVTPDSALVAAEAGGAGIESGAHSYAYTWVTGAGETLPSPLASVTLGQITDPTTAPTGYTPGLSFFGSLNANGAYKVKYVYATDALLTQNTLPSSASATITANANASADAVAVFPYSTNPAVLYVVVYRTIDGGSTYYRQFGEVNLPAGGTFEAHIGGTSDATLVTHPTEPVANTTAVNQVALSGIAVGPTGTTQRKVYRTVAAGSQLKLQQTIANNTATTGTQDSTADASLGANVPVSDTSGLTTTDGTVVAGSTSLRVASTGPFSATGGWAVIGNGEQAIHYTGYSADSLTGIPASGDGAITAAVSYGSTVTVAPQLTGIAASGTGSILTAIKKGDPVNLIVTSDDASAQTTLASLIGGTEDGIFEDTDQNNSLGLTESLARAEAQVRLASRALTSLRYRSRDTNTRSGRTITVSIAGTTNISGAWKIQQVTIADFSNAARVFPTYQAEASSVRFSFENLIRLARQGQN